MTDDLVVIEKIMALTQSEFLRALASLDAGAEVSSEPVAATMAAGAGKVRIQFEPLDEVRLGGLLSMPRARVSLSFTRVGPDERRDFILRFDRAFQRGGG